MVRAPVGIEELVVVLDIGERRVVGVRRDEGKRGIVSSGYGVGDGKAANW